ncbi:hypothetical protein ACWDUI_35560 [Streptosporangium sandarakinum]
MPVRLRRHAQPGGAGVADQRGDVIGVGGLGHGRHRLLDRQVPRTTGGVEAGVAGQPDPAADDGAQGGQEVHGLSSSHIRGFLNGSTLDPGRAGDQCGPVQGS